MPRSHRIITGDCRKELPKLAAGLFDACATDPPYEISFMGQAWDSSGVAFDPATWRAVLRVLKPGGLLVAFGAPRTAHRLTCAIEDAGFEIRDTLLWLYGQGMNKSGYIRNEAGDPILPGVGGSLKPGYEPIILARKPFKGSLRANLLKHGTGGLNIDDCRVATADNLGRQCGLNALGRMNDDAWQPRAIESDSHPLGRWPANVLHDGSDEVLSMFPDRKVAPRGPRRGPMGYMGASSYDDPDGIRGYDDSGSAARFFYCAKASKADRGEGNTHETVKPQAVMRWLIRLVVPVGGHVIDPFGGSGTTGVAAALEDRSATLITNLPEHAAISARRLETQGGIVPCAS